MSAGHDHGSENMSDARLWWAVAVNVLLTFAQIVGGIFSGSLSLIADALHNFSDAAALGLALFARKIGRRPADKLMTFGYARAELVAALINLTTLIIVGFYLIVDIVTALMVYAGSKKSLNIKAAFLHNVSDALASVGVIVAGVLIILYDLYVADLIMTLVIAAYVIYQGFSIMPRTVRLLMGAVPDDVEFDHIVRALEETRGISTIHHVHVWSLDEHSRALEAHIVPVDTSLERFEELKASLRRMLSERFAIRHATLEACLETECQPKIVAHANEVTDKKLTKGN